jgi:hypothetical protein
LISQSRGLGDVYKRQQELSPKSFGHALLAPF